MNVKLQPKIAERQQLIRAGVRATIQRMVANSFDQRLRAALEHAGISTHRAAPGRIASMFGVSREAARKWLEGESRPTNRRLEEMAAALNVRYEWLATGRGPMTSAGGDEPSKPGSGADDDADQVADGSYVIIPLRMSRLAGRRMVLDRDESPPIAVRGDWLQQQRSRIGRDGIIAIYAPDRAMEPIICHRDLLIIDTKPETLDGGICVIRYDDALIVRRVFQRFDRSMVIKAARSEYPEDTIPSPGQSGDRIDIIGRVIWRAGRID